jgi:hypothetical protein
LPAVDDHRRGLAAGYLRTALTAGGGRRGAARRPVLRARDPSAAALQRPAAQWVLVALLTACSLPASTACRRAPSSMDRYAEARHLLRSCGP